MRNNRQVYFLIFSAFLIFAFSSVISAKKIKQTHRIEKGRDIKPSGNVRNNDIRLTKDSLIIDSIRFTGYDKPINASKESFHIINNSAQDIKKAAIRITYLDLSDRMLHSRDTEVECNVPSRETRLISIPAWDRQHTFYYYLGPEPRRVGTPYKVAISLLWIEH